MTVVMVEQKRNMNSNVFAVFHSLFEVYNFNLCIYVLVYITLSSFHLID